MNPPQVYTCSPSWTLLPPPSPYHPSGSSQCTSPKHPVSCIEPGLASCFIHAILHVSMPFSQIFPPSPSHTESIFFKSILSIFWPCPVACETLNPWPDPWPGPCSGSSESQPLEHQKSPQNVLSIATSEVLIAETNLLQNRNLLTIILQIFLCRGLPQSYHFGACFMPLALPWYLLCLLAY